MSIEKKKEVKARLHPRNRNRERYDLSALIVSFPELGDYITPNKLGVDSVDFSNPKAVKLLNQAILLHYYGIKNWKFPDENLCPPIPGRADYIHHIADLLSGNNFGTVPTGEKVICLDVGVGASCIYPIIGVIEYAWNFIGSDIDEKSINSAERIIQSNETLKGKIECRLKENPNHVFHGILGKEELVDLTICNPPFHASIEDALKGTRRKIKNLSGKDDITPSLNFAGMSHELVCNGGENRFIRDMINESKKFAKNCLWFSTLVSKQSNLKGIHALLEKKEVVEQRTIPMGTGNKSSRIVAWTFHSRQGQKEWRETRWKNKK